MAGHSISGGHNISKQSNWQAKMCRNKTTTGSKHRGPFISRHRQSVLDTGTSNCESLESLTGGTSIGNCCGHWQSVLFVDLALVHPQSEWEVPWTVAQTHITLCMLVWGSCIQSAQGHAANGGWQARRWCGPRISRGRSAVPLHSISIGRVKL